LANAWCGAAPHGAFEVLGHCPACWVGAASLAALAAVVMKHRPARDPAPAYWAV
jgi:hypothetical protein